MVAEDRPTANKHRNFWLTEEDWQILKKFLVNSQYPPLRGKCYEACLELRFDTVPKQALFNVIQIIGRNKITY